ncbi:hypothetical protein EVAR_85282_1 [Eumeta japonica]|uniref:Uncharacterized protein n=1 Tax=Eumeta variegata TaxID=151549 RepID=A0A4C1V8D1_EUMVA|nr:hypothetical protein EVAR_85282_1 [Eumeta japonica]
MWRMTEMAAPTNDLGSLAIRAGPGDRSDWSDSLSAKSTICRERRDVDHFVLCNRSGIRDVLQDPIRELLECRVLEIELTVAHSSYADLGRISLFVESGRHPERGSSNVDGSLGAGDELDAFGSPRAAPRRPPLADRAIPLVGLSAARMFPCFTTLRSQCLKITIGIKFMTGIDKFVPHYYMASIIFVCQVTAFTRSELFYFISEGLGLEASMFAQ